MAVDADFVSDLNAGEDRTIPADSGAPVQGKDAVAANNQAPVKEPTAQAKIVSPPKPDGDKPASIRDIISGALKGEGTTPDAALEGDRPRDPATGKFIKTEAELAADALAAPADPNAKPAPVTAAPQGIDPIVFASLPAETQEHLARTMDDVQKNQTRFAQLVPIEQLITPRVDAWALNGMAPAQVLHQLLALSDFAGRDINGFIKYMAQTNNVDLEALVLGMDGEEQVDPKYAELQKQLKELQDGRTQEQHQRQQAAHDDRVSQVITFASEKGGDGSLLRPYFEELGNDVLPFISAVQAQNPQWSHPQVLQEAYDRACWGTPSVRAKMQAATEAAGEADRIRKEAEKVANARTASSSVRSGVPTSAPAAPTDAGRSVRDVIKGAIAQHS